MVVVASRSSQGMRASLHGSAIGRRFLKSGIVRANGHEAQLVPPFVQRIGSGLQHGMPHHQCRICVLCRPRLSRPLHTYIRCWQPPCSKERLRDLSNCRSITRCWRSRSGRRRIGQRDVRRFCPRSRRQAELRTVPGKRVACEKPQHHAGFRQLPSMREFRSYEPVRGARGNPRPYREPVCPALCAGLVRRDSGVLLLQWTTCARAPV